MSNEITLIDSTCDSLTVSWPETAGAERYVLQYRKADDKDELFETLSDKLTTPQARKINLADDERGSGFIFRGGAVLACSNGGSDSSVLERTTSWTSHSDPFRLLTAEQDKHRMNPPKVVLGGTNASLRVAWTPEADDDNDTTTYELQMRENRAGAEWTTIATSFKGKEVRKKHLTSQYGYQFRVRSVGKTSFFSSPSEPVVALGFTDGLKHFFRLLEHETLLQKFNQPPVPIAEALGGKEFVLLYASAHWCGPCRQFTPMLTKWYLSKGTSSTCEVVFLSADHDKSEFQSYYKDMPWCAVDYDNEGAREQLMAHIKVSGIPRLAVLDGRTGKIVEDNAVGKPLDVNRWRTLAGR